MAKGNTFNMMMDHIEAGLANQILTVFDVSPEERNRAIPTVAPKVETLNRSNSRSMSSSSCGYESSDSNVEVDSGRMRSNSNPVREFVMNGGKPWGIRLKGGRDCGAPLSIATVNPSSKAYNVGLLVNDHIVLINDQEAGEMSVLEAQELISETGDDLKICITRESFTRRMENDADDEFFEDLKRSMSGENNNRRAQGVKGNSFKKLQSIVDVQFKPVDFSRR